MPSRWTGRRIGLLAGAVLIVIALLAVAAIALGGSADVVVYNGRSQYGDEQAFKAFEDETGLDVELRGGTAPELYERLRREGDETAALADQVPAELRDGEGAWWGISTRIRTPMRSTDVPEDAVRSYEDLGD